MMKTKQQGVVLLSLVGILTLLTIAAIVGVVAFSQKQAKLPNEVVDRQVNQMFTFASALSRCYHDYRDWRLCDANRVVTYYPSNSPTGSGYVAMDGNAVTWQVVPGAGSPEEDLDISFSMASADSARRIQRFLPNARVSGTRVTWTLDPPTETVDHVNQIARYADNVYQAQTDNSPSNNRNQVEIDLSFGQDDETVDERQSLNNLQRVDINHLRLSQVDQTDTQGGTLTIGQTLTIEEQDEALVTQDQAKAEIFVEQGALVIQTDQTQFSGNVQVEGNINAQTLDVQGQTVIDGDAEFEQLVDINGMLAFARNVAANGFSGNDFCIDNTNCVNQNRRDINANTAENAQQAQAIAQNRSAINRNADDIRQNQAQIDATALLIAQTQRDIAREQSRANTNQTNSTSNRSELNALDSPISANTRGIAENRQALSQLDLDQIEAGLRTCINVTRYCIPEKPRVTMSCTGCNRSDRRPDYTATITANISGCRQGCTYEWTVSGGRLDRSCNENTSSIEIGQSGIARCEITIGDLAPQEHSQGDVIMTVTNRVYNDDPAFRTTESIAFDLFNATPLEPVVSVSCDGCDQNTDRDAFSATVTGVITNCPQGCTYSWSVSGGASAACPSGSVGAGGSANPICRITDTLEAQTGSSGTATLTARNAVSPSASDSDSVTYSFFNSTSRLDNCSSQQYVTDVPVGDAATIVIDIPVVISAPAIAHNGSQRFTGQLPAGHCPSSQFFYDITLSCNDGRLFDTAAFAMCTAF